MQVAIRADASSQIGGGHIARCMTLAEELRDRGATVRFLCLELPGNMISVLRDSGYQVDVLSYSTAPPGIGTATCGTIDAGQVQLVDASQAIKALRDFQCDWLIEDHYQMDATWENAVRPYTRSLLVIDDLANRKHDCDVLVDPTYGGSADRYSGLLNRGAICLCGSQYALLRRQFLTHRPSGPKTFKGARDLKVHIFFGSSDLPDNTHRFSEILLQNFESLRVSAVVGKEYGFSGRLAELQKRFGAARFAWEMDVADMAASMVECDIAVGAPGGATWERAALGLPAAYLAVSESQCGILEHLSACGLCIYLGRADQLADSGFIEAMHDFLGDSPRLEQFRRQGMLAVDACGTPRVADILERNS